MTNLRVLGASEDAMKFYESAPANALYRDYVKALLTRTNSITGTPYADDPTIMAWQLVRGSA